jgi:hypothetical protein
MRSSRKRSEEEYVQLLDDLKELAKMRSSLPRSAQDRRRDERTLERIYREKGEALRYQRDKKDPPRVKVENQTSARNAEKSPRPGHALLSPGGEGGEGTNQSSVELRPRLKRRRDEGDSSVELRPRLKRRGDEEESSVELRPRLKRRGDEGDSSLESRPRLKRRRDEEEFIEEADQSSLESRQGPKYKLLRELIEFQKKSSLGFRPRPERCRGQEELEEEFDQSKSPPLEDVAHFTLGREGEGQHAESVPPIGGSLEVPPPQRAEDRSVRTETSSSAINPAPPQRGVDVSMCKDGSVTHVTLTGDTAFLSDFGTTNPDFLHGLISQIGNAGLDGHLPDETNIKFMFALVRSMKPRDGLQAAILTQMAALQVTCMDNFRRFNHGATQRERDAAERAIYRLTGRFASLFREFQRPRLKDQIGSIIQNVSVNGVGQAIIHMQNGASLAVPILPPGAAPALPGTASSSPSALLPQANAVPWTQNEVPLPAEHSRRRES